MIQRKDRTLDAYEDAGAVLRLLKTLGTKAAVEVSPILHAADTDKLLRALDKVDEICSRAEENMFRDYPQLPSQYIDVFYGAANGQPLNEVDEKIHKKMEVVARELTARA